MPSRATTTSGLDKFVGPDAFKDQWRVSTLDVSIPIAHLTVIYRESLT
jgi:hypothetical protein